MMTGIVGSYRQDFFVNVLLLTEDQTSFYNSFLSVAGFVLSFFYAMVIDNHKIGKRGKFVPIVNAVAIPMGIVTMLLFYTPDGLAGTLLMIYLISIGMILFNSIIFLHSLMHNDIQTSKLTLQYVISYFLNTYFMTCMLGLLTTITEWNSIQCKGYKKILYIFTFPIFMFTYMPISICSILKKVEWKPIKHSINKSIDYNLDFTNCRFEFDTIPYCAFCKISPFTLYSWDVLIERYGTPDIPLEEDGALVNLKSIILPDSIKEIDRNAFAYCFNMKLEQLPESLEKIWFNAFLYCKSITINKIPDTVTFLQSDAFARCNGITSIQLPNNIEHFDTSVFDNCENISEIKIPASVQRISNGYGATYFDFDVDNNNNYFSAIDGILYSRDGKTLYRIPISKVGTSYTIPSSVSRVSPVSIV